MSWPLFQETCRSWLASALGAGATAVIYGEQDGPRPTKPYATCALVALVPQQAVPDLCPLDAVTAVRPILARYEATMSVQFYGATALTMAETARTKLYTNAISKSFKDAGCPVQRTTGINRIPEIVGSRIEDRYQFDVTMGLCASETETLNWIEHVRARFIITDGGALTVMDKLVDII